MGAVIGMKKMPESAWKEAEVALAGPLLGSLGAAAVWLAGSYYHSQFLVGLAFVGFFINLFNLIPVVPLDGGRAVAALHPAIWLVGLVGLVALTVLRPSPILPLIIVVGSLELGDDGSRASSPASPATTGSRAGSESSSRPHTSVSPFCSSSP